MAYEENNPSQNSNFSDENHISPFHSVTPQGNFEVIQITEIIIKDGDPFDGVESDFVEKKGFLNFIKQAVSDKKGGFLGFIEDLQDHKKTGGFISFIKESLENAQQNQTNVQNYNQNNPNYNPNYGNQNYNNPNYNPNYGNQNYNNPNYNNPAYVNQNYNNPNPGNQTYNPNPGNPNYTPNTPVANNNGQPNTPFQQIGQPNPNQPIVPIKQPGSEGYVDPFDDLATRMEHAKKVVEGINDTMAELLSPVSGPVVPVISQYKKDPNQDGFESLNEKLFFSGKERTKNTEEEKLEVKEKLEYLKVKIQLDSFKYRGWEKKSKNWALIFRLMSSALAAIVTVLLGFNVTDTMRDWGIDWYINTVALIITAFISIIGVIQGFFDANELYIKYTDTANKLEHLGSTIEYLELGLDYAHIDDVNAVKIEYDEIIESTHDYEVRVRAKEQEGFNQGKLSRTPNTPK